MKETTELFPAFDASFSQINFLLERRSQGENITASHIIGALFAVNGPVLTAIQGGAKIREELKNGTEEEYAVLGDNIGRRAHRIYKEIQDIDPAPASEQ